MKQVAKETITPKPRQLTGKHISLIRELLRELASEIDLHYEDDDMLNLNPTIKKLKQGSDLLTELGEPVPIVVKEVIRRFRKHYQ